MQQNEAAESHQPACLFPWPHLRCAKAKSELEVTLLHCQETRRVGLSRRASVPKIAFGVWVTFQVSF